jgi:ElaB/YqjD/DUF883 family membrane-anchored ribosome-binding protein
MVDESTKFGAGVEALRPSNAGKPASSSQNGNDTASNSLAGDQAAQLEALRAEIASLKESVSSLASAAKTVASTSFNNMAAEAEVVLKRNVFASVGIAAFIGYVWGRTR